MSVHVSSDSAGGWWMAWLTMAKVPNGNSLEVGLFPSVGKMVDATLELLGRVVTRVV